MRSAHAKRLAVLIGSERGPEGNQLARLRRIGAKSFLKKVPVNRFVLVLPAAGVRYISKAGPG